MSDCKCYDEDEPCGKCRRDIHQSWHAKGVWWIRPEDCDSSCPCHSDESANSVSLVFNHRQRAMNRMLDREAAGEMHLRVKNDEVKP